MTFVRCRHSDASIETDEPELRLSDREEQFCRCGKNECIAHAEGDTGSFLQTVEVPAPEPLPLFGYASSLGRSSS